MYDITHRELLFIRLRLEPRVWNVNVFISITWAVLGGASAMNNVYFARSEGPVGETQHDTHHRHVRVLESSAVHRCSALCGMGRILDAEV